MNTNKNNIPINNNRFITVETFEDCIYIYTRDQHGGLTKMGERISGADFISMLNWYHYQKENGNKNLTF